MEENMCSLYCNTRPRIWDDWDFAISGPARKAEDRKLQENCRLNWLVFSTNLSKVSAHFKESRPQTTAVKLIFALPVHFLKQNQGHFGEKIEKHAASQ